MKKIVLIMLIFVISKTVYATNIEIIDYKSLPLAKEYSEYKNFDINKLPENMFYKLHYDCKYILSNSSKLYIRSSDWGGCDWNNGDGPHYFFNKKNTIYAKMLICQDIVEKLGTGLHISDTFKTQNLWKKS